jgi:hypothetical protein
MNHAALAESQPSIGPLDRLGRALFVGLAVGLGWGIRGDFGHMLGAMFPGAMLGLAFAYVSGQPRMFKWMPIVGAAGALGISLGGQMSYGLLHGYAKSDTFVNFTWGFFTLLCQGGAWGAFGGAAIGMALSDRRVSFAEIAGAIVTALLAGLLFWGVICVALGFDVNPPRNNISVGFTGGVIGLLIWLRAMGRPYAFRACAMGWLAFGLGMAGGRFLGNVTYHFPVDLNTWNVMEIMCGFIGGTIFTAALLGKPAPNYPREEGYGPLSVYDVAYLLGGIPLLHLLLRMPADEQVPEWTGRLTEWGLDNAAGLATITHNGISAMVVFGFVGAAIWLVLHGRNARRFAVLPVLWLGLTMVVIQALHALDFVAPPRENHFNTHWISWAFLVLMGVYAAAARPGRRSAEEEAPAPFPWRRWVGGVAIAWVAIILLSFVVNGDETMRSATTRWPVWSWREGPFPGR